MSENDFLSSSQTLKSPSPRVYFIQSEKKIKLEQSANMTEGGQVDMEDPLNSKSNGSSSLIKVNGKDLMESSLNSSALWTSTENSFVQVTDKLLPRGIQTDQANNQVLAASSQRSPHLLMSNSLSLSAPLDLIQSKRESM